MVEEVLKFLMTREVLEVVLRALRREGLAQQGDVALWYSSRADGRGSSKTFAADACHAAPGKFWKPLFYNYELLHSLS